MFIRIKMDLALNNLQRLICHKTQPTNQPTNHQVLFDVIQINLCLFLYDRFVLFNMSKVKMAHAGEIF